METEKASRGEIKMALGIFSGAFVINVDASRRRMCKITSRLNNIGLEFERFPAVRGEVGCHRLRMRGCGMSHLAVVQEAKRRRLESVLIIEDDAVFRPNFVELWTRLLPQLQDMEYDIFYGYDWASHSRSGTNIGVKRIERSLCTHFWAIHSRFYDSFVEIVKEKFRKDMGAAIDRMFSSETARIYAPTYNLVGQDEGRSLIENKWKFVRWSA